MCLNFYQLTTIKYQFYSVQPNTQLIQKILD